MAARKYGGQEIGKFAAILHRGKWDLWHREINNEYVLSGLGELGIKLIEELVRKRGFSEIRMDIEQKDVLNLALTKLGYRIAPDSLDAFRELLHLRPDEPLPERSRVSELLHGNKCPYKIDLIVVEKGL